MKETIRASFIDRIIDEAPLISEEQVSRRTLTYNQFIYTLRRDLEWLMNTRNSVPAERYLETDISVLEFGLPDITRLSPQNPSDRSHIALFIKKALNYYEHRLQEVEVIPFVPPNYVQSIIYEIKGRLVYDDINEPISFRTILDHEAGEFRII